MGKGIPLLYKAACKLLFFIQKSKLYRRILRRFFNKNISYAVANEEEQKIAFLLPFLGQTSANPRTSPKISSNHFIIIAKIKNSIIACVWLSGFSENFQNSFGSGWWISGLFVKPFWRGLSIGEGLMQETLKLLKVKKAGEVYLTVRENNRPAIKLYEKLGFIKAEIPELDEKLQAEVMPGKPHRIIMKIKRE
jgi:ribosomal protein S18 acetylase RimI-like enzyme